MAGKRNCTDGQIHYWDDHSMMPLCMEALASIGERDQAVTCRACLVRVGYRLGKTSRDSLIHYVEDTGDINILCGSRLDFVYLTTEEDVTCIVCLGLR